MREIMFRAWDKQRNRMVEVFNIRMDGYGLAEPQISIGINNGFYADYERAVLMQFTGLKDKNGKEIYEKDIVEFPKTPHNNLTRIIIKYGIIEDGEGNNIGIGFNIPWQNICVCPDCIKIKPGIEVIGNIFENPELINPNNTLTGGGER